MIEFKGVSKAFESLKLFNNVNFTIPKESSFVIIGPSGHGKSVLLKVMAGILKPSEGQILIDSKNLNELKSKEKELLLKRMGMLFQKNALFDSLTVGDNVAFPMRELTDMDEKSIQDRVDFFLEAVGIAHAKNLFPDEISGGMQKRLGIARALALEPEIIFYDDPTAGLDPITSRTIIQLIIDLKEKNKSTVVSITNDMNRAFQLADQIGMVVDGELILTGNVEQTKSHSDPRVHQFITGELEGPLSVGYD